MYTATRFTLMMRTLMLGLATTLPPATWAWAQTPRAAEPDVAARNRAVLGELPFDDRRDFDDAMRGFVATVPDARAP